MDPGELRFEVTKSKISWGAYFRDLMKPRFGGGVPAATFEDYSGRGPSVVAENAALLAAPPFPAISTEHFATRR